MKDGKMTQRRFEELIQAVADEMGINLRVFAVDHVQRKAGVWAASLTGATGPATQISINTYDQNTEDLVRAEIRRQLQDIKRN